MVLWKYKKKKKVLKSKGLTYTSKEEKYTEENEHLPWGIMRATEEQKGFVCMISHHNMMNTWSSEDLSWDNSIICGLSLVLSNYIVCLQPKENEEQD